MISKTAEYALRAVVHLAEDSGVPCTLRGIAEEAHLPQGYLGKVMQSLVRAGLVDSKRGLHGGFTLARPPSQISALDVITAVDPVRRCTDCPRADPDRGIPLCPLHSFLKQLSDVLEERSRQTMIAELIWKMRG